MGSLSFAAMYHSSPKPSANLPSSRAMKRLRKKAGGSSGEGDEMDNIEVNDFGGLNE